MEDHETEEDDRLEVIDVNKITWHIRPFYRNISYLGGGAFGNVCKCDDQSEKHRELAIKKLYRPFSSGDMAVRAYRELRLLRYLEHDNVLELVDVYTPDQDWRKLENVYLVTGHAGWDLHSVMEDGKIAGRPKLNDEQIQLIVYQLLRGLKYLHSGNIVHRDLKPTNLALSPDCELRILDFGLARKVTWEIMTEYVITRYYRPPEVLCWAGKYDHKADMWSVGCIMAELLTGRILFKGENSTDQFLLIIKMLGSPSAELLEKIEVITGEATRVMIESLGRFQRKDLRDVFEGVDPIGVDFLDLVLVMDPDHRMSVDDALNHKYLETLHMPEDEPVMECPVELDEDSLSREDIQGWRKRVWEEIKDCQKHLKEKAERLAREEQEEEGSSSSASSSTEQ